MSQQDEATATIDALIDTLAELERIEIAARDAREKLTPVCSGLYRTWCSKQDEQTH